MWTEKNSCSSFRVYCHFSWVTHYHHLSGLRGPECSYRPRGRGSHDSLPRPSSGNLFRDWFVSILARRLHRGSMVPALLESAYKPLLQFQGSQFFPVDAFAWIADTLRAWKSYFHFSSATGRISLWRFPRVVSTEPYWRCQHLSVGIVPCNATCSFSGTCFKPH